MSGPEADGSKEVSCVFFTSVEELCAHVGSRRAPIITLGQNLQPDGSASETLLNRLDLALDLQRRTLAPIIVTGGDPAGVGETEAAMMHRLLDERAGADASPEVLEEPEAKSTIENALFTAPILRGLQAEVAILLTSEFHLPRSALQFESTFAHKGLAVTLLCVAAPSGHPRLPSRTPRPWESSGLELAAFNIPQHLKNGGEDMNFWYFAERVEFELILLNNKFGPQLSSLGIPLPPEARIEEVRAQLREILAAAVSEPGPPPSQS
mmetsp:Transcript_91666/g.238921  ORF Transcript_91666/g.238921 Transcript_91666/m.238921 type:complete len:266 (-) Transcript_91666:43-840(-)